MRSDADIQITDLGRLDYARAMEAQRAMLERVVDARDGPAPIPGHIFLVEHDPVITVTPRPGAAANVIASPERLAAAGVHVHPTDRGGDVTYHGPGQLVVYPIIDLNAHGLRLHDYMRLLEQAVIDACAAWGVRAERDPSATGVWVRDRSATTPGNGTTPLPRKVCAMGVRVRRWVSMHGLALNVTTDLSHFDLIIPCGLAGRSVTSLHAELGPGCPAMPAVKAEIGRRLLDALRARRQARSRA